MAFLLTATLNVFIVGDIRLQKSKDTYIHHSIPTWLPPLCLTEGGFVSISASELLVTEHNCFFRHLIHWLKSSLISSASFFWKGKRMTHLISHFRKEGKSFQLGAWETHLLVKERSCYFSGCRFLPSYPKPILESCGWASCSTK